jgi:hypothetical protein
MLSSSPDGKLEANVPLAWSLFGDFLKIPDSCLMKEVGRSEAAAFSFWHLNEVMVQRAEITVQMDRSRSLNNPRSRWEGAH